MPAKDPRPELETPEAFEALRQKIENGWAELYQSQVKDTPVRTRLMALWNLFFGTPSDDRRFANSWRWYARLFSHMVLAGIVVGVLVATHILSLGAPIILAAAVTLGIAFNYALEYVRDHLIPTVQKIREKYVVYKLANGKLTAPSMLIRILFKLIPTRANEHLVDGHLARQYVIPQSVQNNGTPPVTQVAFLKKHSYKPTLNALRSSLGGGLVMIVSAMLGAVFLAGVISVEGVSVAGMMALALPAALAAGFVIVALGFRLAADAILKRSLVTKHHKATVPAWSDNPHRVKHTIAHAFLATSGICAMLAIAALIVFMLPHVSAAAFIHSALAFFHVGAGAAASLPAAAAILGGMVTALAAGVGMLVGGLRSWLYKESGELALFTASPVTNGVSAFVKPESQYLLAINPHNLPDNKELDDTVSSAFIITS